MNSQDNQQINADTAEVTPAAADSAPAETEPAKAGRSSGVGRRGSPAPKPSAVQPSLPTRPDRQGIGRGGTSAIVLMVLFLPIVGILAYLLLDSNSRNATLERSLRNFQSSASTYNAGQFGILLSSPDLQMLPFKPEDGNLQNGRFTLFNDGHNGWAFVYGRLDPLDQDQVYQVWLVRKATGNQPPPWEPFVTLPDVKSAGNIHLVSSQEFPPGFQVAAYSQMVVTVESLTNPPDKQPRGPRRFSLDMANVTG